MWMYEHKIFRKNQDRPQVCFKDSVRFVTKLASVARQISPNCSREDERMSSTGMIPVDCRLGAASLYKLGVDSKFLEHVARVVCKLLIL
jgi:hypothetical protein